MSQPVQTEITPDDLPMPDWTQVDTAPVPADDVPDHAEEEDADV